MKKLLNPIGLYKSLGKHGEEQNRLKETARSTEAWSNIAKATGGAIIVVGGVATGAAGLAVSAVSVSIASWVFSGIE